MIEDAITIGTRWPTVVRARSVRDQRSLTKFQNPSSSSSASRGSRCASAICKELSSCRASARWRFRRSSITLRLGSSGPSLARLSRFRAARLVHYLLLPVNCAGCRRSLLAGNAYAVALPCMRDQHSPERGGSRAAQRRHLSLPRLPPGAALRRGHGEAGRTAISRYRA